MTDRVRCEFFHEFDDRCCSADECCPMTARRRYRLDEPDNLVAYNAIVQRGAFMMILCASVALLVFLALVPTELNHARLAKTYQERIVR